jgi:rhodanese-related sulfurtransferase
MKLRIIICILGFVWFASLPTAGAEGPRKITAPEVKKMVEDDQALLVHVLSHIEFIMQHIPGSINIPITQMETTTKLPKQKNVPIIFYCMGER